MWELESNENIAVNSYAKLTHIQSEQTWNKIC
jgi:hypothetical protein